MGKIIDLEKAIERHDESTVLHDVDKIDYDAALRYLSGRPSRIPKEAEYERNMANRFLALQDYFENYLGENDPVELIEELGRKYPEVLNALWENYGDFDENDLFDEDYEDYEDYEDEDEDDEDMEKVATIIPFRPR